MATENSKYIYSSEAKTGYGFNGIKGDRFDTVAGWEYGTSGFAGNVYSRLAAENGIQPVDPVITASREPFRVGRFLLKVLKTVPFFDDKVTAAWRFIIEDTATEFSGIQSYTFDVFTKQHGVTRQNSAYTGIYKENNGEFTIKVPEYAGQLVRKSIDYWHGGMSDPKTGVAHFYGKDFRDLQPNKSMSILYVLLGPTCRPEDIEYAAIYHDCVVTTPKHDHNNAGSLGEAGQGVEHDLTFSGTFDRGPEVDRLAAIIVDREGLYEERSQNSLLPNYVYKYYMSSGAVDLQRWATGATLADRLANEFDQNMNANQEFNNGKYYHGAANAADYFEPARSTQVSGNEIFTGSGTEVNTPYLPSRGYAKDGTVRRGGSAQNTVNPQDITSAKDSTNSQKGGSETNSSVS